MKPCRCDRRAAWINRTIWPGLGTAIQRGLGALGIHPTRPIVQARLNPRRMLLTDRQGPVRTGRFRIPRVSYPGRPVGGYFPCSAYPIAGGSPVQTAADATQAAIQAVHDSGGTQDGDTIVVPVDRKAWSGVLNLSKAITLQGAGIGQTIIDDTKARGTGGDGVIMNVSAPGGTNLFRLTGFSFYGGDPATQGITSTGTITLAGCSPTSANYRIDH